jgi:hypothetical protein
MGAASSWRCNQAKQKRLRLSRKRHGKAASVRTCSEPAQSLGASAKKQLPSEFRKNFWQVQTSKKQEQIQRA